VLTPTVSRYEIRAGQAGGSDNFAFLATVNTELQDQQMLSVILLTQIGRDTEVCACLTGLGSCSILTMKVYRYLH
jgi:hypothetical protein